MILVATAAPKGELGSVLTFVFERIFKNDSILEVFFFFNPFILFFFLIPLPGKLGATRLLLSSDTLHSLIYSMVLACVI